MIDKANYDGRPVLMKILIDLKRVRKVKPLIMDICMGVLVVFVKSLQIYFLRSSSTSKNQPKIKDHFLGIGGAF